MGKQLEFGVSLYCPLSGHLAGPSLRHSTSSSFIVFTVSLDKVTKALCKYLLNLKMHVCHPQLFPVSSPSLHSSSYHSYTNTWARGFGGMFVMASSWKHLQWPGGDEIKRGVLILVLRFLLCHMGPILAAYVMEFREDSVRTLPGKSSTDHKSLQ